MVCESFLNVQTAKQRGKNLAVGHGPSGGGAPYNGTTGTVVNPTLIVWDNLPRDLRDSSLSLNRFDRQLKT